MTVSVTEAKNKLTELLVAVEKGERVIIERHGKAIAEIHRAQPQRKPEFDGLRGTFVEVDPDWHRPQEDIDAWLRGDV